MCKALDPTAPDGVGATDAVAHLDAQHVSDPRHGDIGTRGARMLGDVCERFGDNEIGDRLDSWRCALIHLNVQADGERRPRRQSGQSRVQAELIEHRWMQAANHMS